MKGISALALVFGCCAAAAFADEPKAGEAWHVSTETLAVRERPDGFSPVVATLKYADRVEVVTTCRYALPFNGDKDKFPETLLPAWVKVKANGKVGYLPTPSIASEWLMGNQNPGESISADGMLAARRGFTESENDVALASMRGFSESEKGELAAMRGAAGAGRVSGRADPAAVARIVAAHANVPDAEIASFVSAGGLVRREQRQMKEEKAEEEGFFGGFMKTTRKAGAGGLGFASRLAGAVGGGNQVVTAAASAAKVTSGIVYSEIGPVQEFQLGCVVASRIVSAYTLLPEGDPRSAYVKTVGAMLAAASNDPMPYHGYMFVTVESDEVNAFAVPGGFVFVTTGMLKFLRDEDELVAILGHEMGHMELRHGMKSVGKENVLKFFSLMKEVAVAKAGADSGANAVAKQQLLRLADELFDGLTTSIRNGYGVEMESQADWRSLQFSKALGYDTKALYDVLERFKAEKGTYGGASYPVERGADVLKYREGFACKDGDGAVGRDLRASRYQTAIGGGAALRQ